MLLHLSDRSPDSLQSQIVSQLRARILAGQLAGGAPLPSIRALAREIRVSVITVKAAYEELQRQGLIYSRKGKGFFVEELADDRRSTLAVGELERTLKEAVDRARAQGVDDQQILVSLNRILKGKKDGKEG